MAEHAITVRAERRPGQSHAWYRAICSCGRYRSGLHGYPGQAERAGRDHVTAQPAPTGEA